MISKENLAALAAEADSVIYSFLPEESDKTETIVKAVSYSVKAGGKRIRPVLMREAYRTFADGSEDPEILKAFMASIEFIHTYSLVHDDLPAMDNDMYRRGQLSTHAAFGHAAGVLAGDALLNLAFEVPLKAIRGADSPVITERALRALSVIADKAGINGMVGGQCLDVFSEKNESELSVDDILYIYHGKTSALIQASLMSGAILAGASDDIISTLEEIGECVGLAFQVRDDILDMISTTEELGKPVGSDEANGKQTYARKMGIDAAQQFVLDYSNKAVSLFESLDKENETLKGLIEYLSVRKN